MMDGERRGGLRRYGTEAFVIVVGILVALFVDAAWEYRGERALEREYLGALRSEFAASARELAADQGARERTLSRAEAAYRAGRSPGASEVVDSAAVWIAALLDFRFYTPAQSALLDLTGSGNLHLVRSDSLRRAILGYIQERDRLQVAEEHERQFVTEAVEPYLRDNLPLDDILPLASLDEELTAPPPTAVSIAPVLSSDAFRNLVYLRWQRAEVSHRFGTGISRRLDRLIRLLDDEIDG